ncbi:MAG: chemotaxis protein CheX, partial [Alphaproteobacteria bacterium]|nr:chemotaxis protein CheX [Alphaproteobacteria bacterium]NDG05423.1 chemotaxis protein CheX [Alphaproteobacteria bacterium]
ICFHEETMKNILPKVLGKDVQVTHDMAMDAVSEITNMIYGHVKNALNSRGFQLKLAIPSVLSGRGQFINHFHRGRYLVMPFNIADRQFQVHIAVHQLQQH